MRHTHIWASLLVAGLLSACGDEGDETPVPVNPSANITLTGVVAKGALSNALVSVHPINAAGDVDTATTLASVTSGSDGSYPPLSFTGTAGQPYVVRVSATATTRQLDEISGDTAVPIGFTLRALFVPATGGTVTTTAHVTPFSELAVAAADNAASGVTAANATQAIANVNALLGFNPTEVRPTTIARARDGVEDTPEQLAYATLLTAVSRMANAGALGCPGAAINLSVSTQCVVNAMSAGATIDNIKPGATVSAALSTALQTVVADNTLSPSAVAIASANLAPTSPGTPPTPPAVGTAAAIAAAKAFFTTLRSDWVELFGRTPSGGVSAVATEGERFEAAMRDVQAPVEVLLKDSGVLLMGLDLYGDFVASRTTLNSRGRGVYFDDVAGNYPTPRGLGNRNAVGCILFTDSTNSVAATTPTQAQSIGCEANYYVDRQPPFGGTSFTVTRYRHGFTILPVAGQPNNFTYSTRASRVVATCSTTPAPGSCTDGPRVFLEPVSQTGTVSVTRNAAGQIVGFTIDGGLGSAFADGGNTLINTHHTWALTGTRTLGTARGDETASISGSITSFDASNNTLGTLTITQAALVSIPVSRTSTGAIVPRGDSRAVAEAGGELATANLDLTWATPGAAFRGSLAMTDSVWDASRTFHIPTRNVLRGQFRTISGGVTTEFLDGSFTLTATGYASFDETLPESPANDVGIGFEFAGLITAPSRPAVHLTLSTSVPQGREDPSALTAQYRTLRNGAATQTINISGSQSGSNPAQLSFTLVDADISLHITEGQRSATLHQGTASNGTVLGSMRDSLLTFVDSSTMSLDFGF